MRTKVYLWHEAADVPDKLQGLTRRGWIWRPHSGTMKWTFTTNIQRRAFPSTAEFVPVYVEEM